MGFDSVQSYHCLTLLKPFATMVTTRDVHGTVAIVHKSTGKTPFP